MKTRTPQLDWTDVDRRAVDVRRALVMEAVEAAGSGHPGTAIGLSWHEWIGDTGESVSLEHSGASAPAGVLYEQFGLTAERVTAAAQASLSQLGQTSGSTTGN